MATLEISGAAIVAIGSFNPPLLSSDWFAHSKLIGTGDAEAAQSREDYLVTRHVTRFHTEFASFQVVESQLAIHAVGPVTPALADLVIGLFELLPHTPVSAVGLNFMAHYRMSDRTSYHHLGDTLAPKGVWETMFPGKMCGTADVSILIQDGSRDGKITSPNQMTIQVQPSGKVAPNGVYFHINNHFSERDAGKPIRDGSDAAPTVREHWQDCWQQSAVYFEQILNLVEARRLKEEP